MGVQLLREGVGRVHPGGCASVAPVRDCGGVGDSLAGLDSGSARREGIEPSYLPWIGLATVAGVLCATQLSGTGFFACPSTPQRVTHMIAEASLDRTRSWEPYPAPDAEVHRVRSLFGEIMLQSYRFPA